MIKGTRRLALQTSLASAFLFCVGCGSGDETSRYQLLPVSGNVTLNSKPLEGAEITFLPAETNKPYTPGGDISGPMGNFKAMYRGRSGLAVGKYKVIIKKLIAPKNIAAMPEEIKADLEMATLAGGQGPGDRRGAKKNAPTLIENSFDREVTSSAEGNLFDFDVKATLAAAAAAQP